MSTRWRWGVVSLLLALIAGISAVVLRDHSQALERQAWIASADSTGCLAQEMADPTPPNAIANFLGLPRRSYFRVFVPDERSAAAVLPLLRGRRDIMLMDVHCEDVSMETQDQLRMACEVPHMQPFNPLPQMSPRLGRHVPGKDWDGVVVAGHGGVAPQ